MKTKKIALYLAIILVGIFVVNQIVHLVWHFVSEYKLSHSEAKQMEVERVLIWHDPGSVSKLNFKWGSGGEEGAPEPPYRFLNENMGGSSPSVFVKDARGKRWRVKWGEEVRSETFASRIVWAAGYFTEIDYFIHEGSISGARNLQRAEGWIDKNDHFRNARFERDDDSIEKRFDEHSWGWNDNPFVGTQEFDGLKILVMFLSNWDNKDRRDVARGSNTAIFIHPKHRRKVEARYMISDWGASMGKWGENILTRGKWNAQGFLDQSQYFVQGIEDGMVRWGYR